VKLPERDIVEMIFFPVVNEACRVLAEGIAVKASDLDIAAVMGMGFPPYRSEFFYFYFSSHSHAIPTKPVGVHLVRGGIMFWADTLGSKYIYSRLEEWSKTYGEFFKPCAYLAERAAKGAPLVRNLQLYFPSFKCSNEAMYKDNLQEVDPFPWAQGQLKFFIELVP
jgi:enoyl-CoA hydratase/3-hydroxyacyl-CoA dehydrogenase